MYIKENCPLTIHKIAYINLSISLYVNYLFYFLSKDFGP